MAPKRDKVKKEVDEKYDQQVATWISDLEGEQDKLNEWEKTFLEDVGFRSGKGFKLTEGQFNKLKEIWERYF